jgi:hypothetical protein
MAVIEVPIAIKHLGCLSIEISIDWGNTLNIYLKSSGLALIVIKLMSVFDLAIDLNSSSCLARS